MHTGAGFVVFGALFFASTRAFAGDVVINEIMYHPSSENVREEYVELFNRGTNTVLLDGWRFTRGIAFTFSNGVAIAPGDYLIVAADRAVFAAKYSAAANVVGNWTGLLANSGEDIELVNATGGLEDTVNYADEGDWAIRIRGGPFANGHQGWDWLAEHDGLGKSLELRNANLSNDNGQNWAASAPFNGTPGFANSVAATNVAPVITDVTHFPLIPSSSDSVTITARILDESNFGLTVSLFYRHATNSELGSFTSQPMFDDGAHNDGGASDGVFGAVMGAMLDRSVVEFYVEATDILGVRRTWPAAALQGDNVTFAQTANALYQVDDSAYSGPQPVMRLIMTEPERAELASGTIRQTDAQMNATLISADGAGTRLRYNVGARIRGAGSRGQNNPVPNFRVNIPSDRLWNGVGAINLNSLYPHAQIVGQTMAKKSGLFAADARVVQVRVNAVNLASAGLPQFSSYALLEVLNADWAENHFPRDPDGNVYRGSTGQHSATLNYLGTNPPSYMQAGYSKTSNASENDWSDLIALTFALNSTADDATYAGDVRQVADVDMWMRYFALFTMLTSMETSFGTGRGDDYAMYRGIVDPRFILIPHDLDTILGQGDTPGNVTANIFRMVPAVNGQANTFVLNRFMRHPELAPIYYRELKRMIDTTFAAAELNPLIDRLLTDFVPANTITAMKNFAAARRAYVLSQIPLQLTATTALPIVNGYPRSTAPTVALNGIANAIDTRSVRVNGSLANWTAWVGTWTNTSVALNPGVNRVLIQAFNADGREIARTAIDIWYDDSSVSNVGGALAADTTWSRAPGPYVVTNTLTVPVSRALTIQPGTTVFFANGAGLNVNGTLQVVGSDTQRIRLTRFPGGGNWAGITFSGTTQSNVLSYCDIEFAATGPQAINVQDSTLYVDHCTWSGSTATIIELNNSSLHVRNSVFPSILNNETIHGNVMPANGFVIIEENFFGTTTGYSDVIDYTGGRRPGPILQVYNNIFTGGGDDALDLDGTDTHVEGNVFMNFIQDAPRDSTANAIATDNQAEVTAVRNLFFNNDHAALLKVGSFLTAHNNTIVGSRIASLNFDEPERPGVTPGRGAFLDGNILWNNHSNFQHRYVGHPTLGTVDLTIRNSIVPGTNVWPGLGNLNADPRLLNTSTNSVAVFTMTNDFRLAMGSPAIGTGPNGLDMGGLVPGGASISGEPESPTTATTALLIVGGPGITHYRYSLNGGPFSSETSVTNRIILAGLTNGAHSVAVIGKNSAARWQTVPTLSRTWVVNTALADLKINEVLARNDTAALVDGEYPDIVELYNNGASSVDLSGMALTDDPANKFKFVIPPGTTLGAGEYLVLYADAEEGAGFHLGFALDQDGDALYLHDPSGNLIDSVTFGLQAPDFSIGRINRQWVLTRPTFGAPNAPQQLGDSAGVKINEWLADGGVLFQEDFVELHNPDSLPVKISGFYLSDEPLGAPDLMRFADLSFLAPFGHVALAADDSAMPAHLPFKISPDLGMIALFDSNLQQVDCVTYGPQSTDISEGRRPSGADAFAFFTQPTPGGPNPGTGTTIIVSNIVVDLLPLTSEWRYSADGAEPAGDWRAPDYDDSGWLSGPALLHNEDNAAIANRNTFIPFTSPQQISFYFRTRFVLNTNLAGFNLRSVAHIDDGAVIYLNGTELVRVRMPGGPITYSTLATNTPPGGDAFGETLAFTAGALLPGTNVLAVELHQQTATSRDIVWGMSLSATRSVTNAISVSAVLNEVMANNETHSNSDGTITDWVELYNPLPTAVDLSDQSLSDDVDTPRRWIFPAGTTVAAGGYLVVLFDGNRPSATNSSDLMNTGFALKSSGDEVFLFDTPARGGGLLNSVSFGLQPPDFSIGRTPNGGLAWALNLPTPGSVNIAASLGSASALRVNEWMANPRSGDDWFEIYNPNNQPVALGGLYLSDNLNNRTKHRIAPLSFISRSTNGFVQFFADNNPQDGADHVSFALSAGGEAVAISSATGALIDGVAFGPQTEGVSQGRLPDGASTIVSFRTTPTPDESNYLPLERVLINEALTHSDLPLEDAIELYNPTAESIDTGGWFISDSNEHLKKFRIPDGTVIAANGYMVFYEYQFNPEPGFFPSFALSSADGDEIYLSEADAEGNLTGYRSAVRFGAAENAVSFGRWETSVGADFTAMLQRTFGRDAAATIGEFRTGAGRSNSAPRLASVVISEVMYHPRDIGGTNDNVAHEYVELMNLSQDPVQLVSWRLRDAISFAFPTNTVVPGLSPLVVVSFDPVTNAAALADFRAAYGITNPILIFGPYSGKLENRSDSVELTKPDAPQPDGKIPRVLVDKFRYEDAAPWPTAADSGTNSIALHRRIDFPSGQTVYGNDPVNWYAATPSPGSTAHTPVGQAPQIIGQPISQSAPPGATVTFSAGVSGTAPLSYQWRFNANDLPGKTNASLTITNIQLAHAGAYTLRVSNPYGAALTRKASLTLQTPPSVTRQPQNVIVAQGQTATFSVAARGTLPMGYQWRLNGTNLPGANALSLTISNVQPHNEGPYAVRIANAYGAVTSSIATLTINEAPTITDQPDSQIVLAGSDITLHVGVSGSPPLGYQWRYNGIVIPGATEAALTLTNVQPPHSGNYSVRVTNAVGSVISDSAVLSVVLPPVITVVAADSLAFESGGGTTGLGAFRITRDGATNFSTTVNLSVTGSAINGVDYQPLASTVTFGPGPRTLAALVRPIDDAQREGRETVVLTIAPGTGYTVGTPSSATVELIDDDNASPAIAITSPATDSFYPITPTNIVFTVMASDPDGQVARVEFYNHGTNLIGQALTAPFTFVWTNATPGSNSITALAVDGLGGDAVSAAVTLIVNVPPRVAITSPLPDTSFLPGTNVNIVAHPSDDDGDVMAVEFYVGSSLIGADTNAPYTAVLQNVQLGSYQLRARAIDNHGMVVISTPVQIIVKYPTSGFADMFADRGEINTYLATIEGTNTFATREPGEPPPYASSTRSMWLRWVAPESGPCRMHTFGSGFDTVLSVYTNGPPTPETLQSLRLVAENDDFNSPQSQVSFNAVAGTAYQVRIEGFGAAAGAFVFHQILSTPAPRITTQPQNALVVRGATATFRFAASATVPFTNQWRFNGTNIPGATGLTLSITNVQPANEGIYTVVAGNSFGSDVSAPARLTIGFRPVITQQPISQTVTEGSTAVFRVSASGNLPMSYRWRFNGITVTNITLESNTCFFVIPEVRTNHAGGYTVVVTNRLGSGPLSANAVLTVLADRDRDGMPDVWEMANGFAFDNDSDAELDADQDTMSNRDEYIAGTDPRNPASYLKIDRITATGAVLLTFSAVSNRSYTMQFSDTLGAGWSRLLDVNPRTTNRVENIIDTNAPPLQRFYRLATPQQF